MYCLEMDAATGKLHGESGWRSTPAATFPGGGPWCTPSPSGANLYVSVRAGEEEQLNYIAALAVDAVSGALQPVGKSTTVLPGSPHCSVSPDGKTLVSSMMSGGAASFAVQQGGSLSPAASVIKFPGGGSGVRMKPTFAAGYMLQDRCLGHSAQMMKDGKHVLVPDLGADKVWAFSIGPDSTIQPCAIPFWQARGGSGPRHMATHPNGKWMYLICEISCEIVPLRWDAAAGSIHALEPGPVSTLPADWAGEVTPEAGEVLGCTTAVSAVLCAVCCVLCAVEPILCMVLVSTGSCPVQMLSTVHGVFGYCTGYSCGS